MRKDVCLNEDVGFATLLTSAYGMVLKKKNKENAMMVRTIFKSTLVAALVTGMLPITVLQAATRARPVVSSEDESGDDNVVIVKAMGKGATPAEAKLAAFRDAVEKAIGIYVDAESIMDKCELVKDRVNTISNADIQRYETIKEGKASSGACTILIKAWVEKKAITPKFADIFPAAFADVGETASTIHVQKVTAAKRAEDAAALMTAAMEGIDRMRNWTRLSVAKGKGLEEVKTFKNRNGRGEEVVKVPGKGLYAVRYCIKIDHDAYFKGFLPHFKEVLTKIQEGTAAEDVALTSGPLPDNHGKFFETDADGRKVLKTDIGKTHKASPDLEPFVKGGYGEFGHTYFVDPIVLSGFPGMEAKNGLRWSGRGSEPNFMFNGSEGTAKINAGRPFNIWLLDRMNKSRTSVRCSAYKVPDDALRAYWKALYGDLDSAYRGRHKLKAGLSEFSVKIEIVLLDKGGEEISAKIDNIPTWLLQFGYCDILNAGLRMRRADVFESFFIRPMFVCNAVSQASASIAYSSEIQRDVYFPLADEDLAEVKQVKVRYVGGKSAK